ncbi:MAG TPA: MaoC/PaaZ C-terminal domain-containing protein, partial [Xanthobacteraceae bacterium]|nr:MaoC/PaaZ C-terminal domain-containing protein [Xanthobacteraceae bacterium]
MNIPAHVTTTVEALKARVGEEVGISDWHLIDQARIDGFAEVTDDHQFIHVDPVRAKAETPFGGTIAHGFLTLSMLATMGYEALPLIENRAMG